MAETTPPLMQRLAQPVDLLALAAAGSGIRQLLTVRGWTVALADPIAVIDNLPELSHLAALLDWRGNSPEPTLPPFTGGLAGFLTDELSPSLLDLPATGQLPAPVALPPCAFGLYDTVACQSPTGEQWLAAIDIPGYSLQPAAQRLEQLHARSTTLTVADAFSPAAGIAVASMDAAAHATAISQILEWIAAGDLYQLNLTLQIHAPWAADGQALARRLWAATPGAAHAAWIGLPPDLAGGAEIVSVSPETFLRCEGDQAQVRPIKGTRPRHHDAAADARAREALLVSDKERAEHVMIVDLERNDLGRVAVPGTVRVSELAALEAHPTVWHLTSTVNARLRDDVAFQELLAAMFPCGSVTGAPKRMAVERIRRLETTGRGVYCGAIGVIGPGLVDLSVAIRTAVVHNGTAHYGAGGGIVADSNPTAEWQEVLDKAEAFFAATNTRLV